MNVRETAKEVKAKAKAYYEKNWRTPIEKFFGIRKLVVVTFTYRHIAPHFGKKGVLKKFPVFAKVRRDAVGEDVRHLFTVTVPKGESMELIEVEIVPFQKLPVV